MRPPREPVVFIGHGSPMNIVRDNAFTRSLALLGTELGKPRAALVVSAHWLTRGETRASVATAPRTIHDFGGFPPELYLQRYPAPGAPDDARAAIAAVRSVPVKPDPEMGLDHGAWSVLRHLWPDADVPVFQLSIDWNLPPARHLELGRELLPLRDRGIMILASGNVVHNLALITPAEDDPDVPDWALEFDAWVERMLVSRDADALARYAELSPAARIAVAMNDHYLPLLYAVGATASDDRLRFTHAGFQNGSISMRCFACEQLGRSR